MARDPDEFERLLRRYSRLMSAAVRRVCGRRHRELVPDAEQEVYLALWKRLGNGKEIAFPTSYLYRMALTTALAMVRKHEKEPAADGVDELAQPVPAPGASDGLEPAERRRLISELLARAEPDEARALRAYLAGFSHLEVAELYGWSESVARHRIYRTLERLKREATAAKGGEER